MKREKKVTSFWRDVCKEEIWRLLKSQKTLKNLPEFNQQELATLDVSRENDNVIEIYIFIHSILMVV